MMIEINPVKKTELGDLAAMAKSTFLDTFAHLNTVENIEFYTSKSFSPEQIKIEFETDGSTFFFVRVDREIAGYLKLNTGDAQTETGLENSLEIERIYVRDQFQGQKLGKALFQFAIQFAKDRNANWVWLGVWDENAKAIEFYKRQGLAAFAKHDFKLGSELQTDILMKLAI